MSRLPGLNPFTVGWFLWVLIGCVAATYADIESIRDYRAAKRSGRPVAIIEGQHALGVLIGRWLVQLAFLAGAVVAILSPMPISPRVRTEIVIQSALYVLAETVTQALIYAELWRRFRLDRVPAKEFMRLALNQALEIRPRPPAHRQPS